MVRHNSKNQLSIEEFKTPFQKSLNPENRWAKLSLQIPWDKLAEIYYGNMSKDQGAPCRDARMVIGAMIIKHKLNLSDEETVRQIQENPYMQYFLGFTGFTEEPVFVPSLFVEIRKRLGADKFDEMNKEIMDKAFSGDKKSKQGRNKTTPAGGSSTGDGSSDNSDKDSPNKGKLILDATVAEQAIKYPNEILNCSMTAARKANA